VLTAFSPAWSLTPPEDATATPMMVEFTCENCGSDNQTSSLMPLICEICGGNAGWAELEMFSMSESPFSGHCGSTGVMKPCEAADSSMRWPSTPVSFLDPRTRLEPLLGSALSLKSGEPNSTMRRLKFGAACSARQEDPRHCQEAHEAYGQEPQESAGASTGEQALGPDGGLQPPSAGTTISAPARTIDPVSCPYVQTKPACDAIERLLEEASIVGASRSARKARKAPRGASATGDSTSKLMKGVGTEESAKKSAKKGAAEKTEADVCQVPAGASGGRARGGQVTATMYTFSTALLESVCVCVCMCVCGLLPVLNVFLVLSLVGGGLIATDAIATEWAAQDIYDHDHPAKENSFFYIFGSVTSPVVAVVGITGLVFSIAMGGIAHMCLTYSKNIFISKLTRAPSPWQQILEHFSYS